MNQLSKLVCDANVLVSAALFYQSKPRQVLDKILSSGILLCSEVIFLEIKEVLFRPKFNRYLTLAQREKFLDDLSESVVFIEIIEEINECRDTKDNKYLELAVSGQAESIITGDQDLLILNPFRNITILTVQAFLENLN